MTWLVEWLNRWWAKSEADLVVEEIERPKLDKRLLYLALFALAVLLVIGSGKRRRK